MWKQGIKTLKLKLMPLTADQLSMYLYREREFSIQVGQASREILTDDLRRAITMKMARMTGNLSEDMLWITYWLIQVPPDDFGAGMIGFKGGPDERGQVEIGYGIAPEYQNKGYTTEALEGLIHWAFDDSRCRRIIAPDTLKSNIASNRVLQKVGMQVYDEKPDTLSWCLDRDQEGI